MDAMSVSYGHSLSSLMSTLQNGHSFVDNHAKLNASTNNQINFLTRIKYEINSYSQKNRHINDKISTTILRKFKRKSNDKSFY